MSALEKAETPEELLDALTLAADLPCGQEAAFLAAAAGRAQTLRRTLEELPQACPDCPGGLAEEQGDPGAGAQEAGAEQDGGQEAEKETAKES